MNTTDKMLAERTAPMIRDRYRRSCSTAASCGVLPLISRRLDRFVATIPDELPQSEQLLLVYYAITQTIRYDYGKKEQSYSFVGGLAGNAVCQGIHELLHMILSKLGIKCEMISGVIDGTGHAWNVVWLQEHGEAAIPYHIDATFDLQTSVPTYFLRSDATLRKKGRKWLMNEYPTCRFDHPLPCIDQSMLEKAVQDFRDIALFPQSWVS